MYMYTYPFVDQLCICLRSRASYFENSNAMVSKDRIMGSDYEILQYNSLRMVQLISKRQ